MMITEENIEIYLLDLLEGRLNQEEEQAVHAYLSAHPHWKKYGKAWMV